MEELQNQAVYDALEGANIQSEWRQGFRDSILIENRIKILELEKQKKIKDIQKKLNVHKNNVQLKILKQQRYQDVENKHKKEKMSLTQHCNRFQLEKKQRQENIRGIRQEMQQSKNKEFWSVKKQREEIEKKIHEQKALDKQQNIGKRNRVRLMEIESKENLYNSWNRRLSEMKQSRQNVIEKKLKEHEQNLIDIAKMNKKEKQMLDQIYKAEEMEKELEDMISNEGRMSGHELAELYKTVA